MEEKFVITDITRVVMVGKDEYPEKISSFSAKLDRNELIFHFSGQATVFFGEQTLETAANTVRFLPQGDWGRHDVLRHEAGECIDVCFRADREIAPQAFVLEVAQSEKLGTLFRRLFATWASKKAGYYFDSVSLLYRILAELQRERQPLRQHALRIAPTLEVIHSEFLHRDFTLAELAALSGIGESYFQKLFKERFGISPKKYIIQLKINHACDLLRLERYSVSKVAELCNFSDVYFFSRQFKEYMQITPTQFIKKYRSSK